ncbi:DUF1592 domain-containing protein [bacterium]|nr:DUF1592 domain-containing protein [bacterium]
MRLWLLLGILSILPAFGNRGAEIYTEHCASCHGDRGQGVADEYDEALVGKKSITSLAKYIHRTMPEDDEEAVVDEDARLVAEYIHKSFYSPEAQARLKPVRKALLRRTQNQHRRAITDIVQSFRNRAWMGDEHGLRGHYFNKEKMNNRKEALVKRVDPTIDFDVHKKHGVEALDPKAHSIFWTGSILPPETGEYGFRIKTPNGVRIFLNEPNQKKDAFIDAWVSSGNQMRTIEKSTFLLGGHPVPIFVEFICYKEDKSSLLVEWKPPHGTWESIPSRVLYTAGSQKAAIISTPFPADDASLGYERGSSISKAWKEAVANAAIEATSTIFDDIDELAGTKPDQPDRKDRFRKFCSEFAFRTFSRPLTSSQQQVYIDDVFAAAGDDYETAVKRSLMLTLTSPYFLYPSLNRNEAGKADSYSTAAHLALALWDSIPDKRLFEAAEKNQLSDDRQLTDQLWKMLADSRSKAKLHRFFHHWLNLSEKEDLDKDPKLFPGFNEQIIADLRTSLDLFIDDVVWSEQSDYRRLFLEKRLYLNPRLAEFYGVQEPPHDGFEPLPTPDKTRAGIFTHPFVLTAFSYHKQTSPIHRGVYLSRNVLGRFLKPPPNAIEFKDADFKPNLTMREKVTEITKDESCMACHSIINPVGFSLENYDAIGRFRTHEKDKPINTVSEYPTPDDTLVKIAGPNDLARLAIESPGAHRAFLKHLFHHLIQQPTNAFGYGTMGSLHETFMNSNFHIRNIIVTIAKDTAPR